MALLSALPMEIAIPVCVVIGIGFSLVQWRFPCRSWYSDIEEAPDAAQQGALDKKYSEIQEKISKGVETFLSTECWYAGVFVVVFAILIFLLLGSVEWFSTQSRPCKFDTSNTCKHALVTAVFSTVSFVLGASTSVLFGYLGTGIAIYAATGTASEDTSIGEGTSRSSAVMGFLLAATRTAKKDTSFTERTTRSCAVMGFLLAAIDLLALYLAIILFKLYYGNDWEGLFEAITGYVLGGSSLALFKRVSGGIYATAADVCVQLVERSVQQSQQPYRHENQAVITNFVGDIVGDIAGMGPDLFGSYAGSSCAALVLASISSFGIEHNFTAMCYPLLISSMGILAGLITTVWGLIKRLSKMKQFIISTILMTFGIIVVSLIALPSSFTIYNIGSPKVVKNWKLCFCVGAGLWAGLISGFVDIIYINDGFSCLHAAKKICSCLPDDAANKICRICSCLPECSCLPDDAANKICSCLPDVCAGNSCSGLQAVLKSVSAPLGSVSIPLCAAISIFAGYNIAATYGIAVAALGMLSTIATRLAIDASGPMDDIAKRIAEAADPIGAKNTTAGIGKGFAIESAALVSIAMLGAFVNRPAMSSSVDVLTPKVIVGVIMGTWLPYWFSAMTMKSAGRAGFEMAVMVCRQLEPKPKPQQLEHEPEPKPQQSEPEPQDNGDRERTDCDPHSEIAPEAESKPEQSKSKPQDNGDRERTNPDACFGIATKASFRWMIGPSVLVLFTPLIIGTVFGVETLSGLLAGSLSSVVQIAVSASKTDDGVWNQAKEDIRAGALEYKNKHCRGETTPPGIAQSGKTIGDPRKDTSGPPLNILIQLMAVESLVFAPFFASYGGLLFKFL